jgi:hypothetical protein
MEAEIFSQTAVNIYKTTRHHGHKITNLLKERTYLRKPEAEVRLLIRPALREQGGKTGIVYLKRGFHKTL